MKNAQRNACIAIAAFVVFQIIFVNVYISGERTIYHWDHAMYFGMARGFYETLRMDGGAARDMFHAALAQNYNLIFTLPSLISFSLFGVSRLTFILTNFIVFFLAYEWAAAFFLRRLLKLDWLRALLLSLAAASLTPPLWLPLLEGYPDSGAGACIATAAALAFGAASGNKLLRRGLLLGAVLGLAVLLRRHFVYPGIAVLIASGLLAVWDMRKAWKKKFIAACLYYGACVAGFAGVLFLVAPEFVQDAITTDYKALYKSYERPIPVFLHFTAGGFGLGILLLAALGLALLMREKPDERKAAIYCVLILILWLLLWCFGPNQMGHHYMLHALPLVIAAGLAGCFIFAETRKDKPLRLAAALITLVLAANSIWALWLSPTGVWPNDNGQIGLFSAARPPVIRSDYDELHRLAQHIVATTRNGDRIMVVGSSFIFNQDILHKIFEESGAGFDAMARIPKAPEIDHEEPAPFDVFASADVYLVPTPAQYHLDPDGQRVVRSAANQFPPPSIRADMFHAEAGEYKLADGVTLKIWRRDAWKPGMLFDALADIRRDGPQDPGFDQQWVATKLPLRAQIRSNNQGLSIAGGLFHPEYSTLTMFFDHKLEAGSHRLGLVVLGDCPDTRFTLRVLDEKGRVETTKKFTPPTIPSELYSEFAILAKGNGYFLELMMETRPAAICRAELQNLRVERQ